MKNLCFKIISLLLAASLLFTATACVNTQQIYKIQFIVDGDVYSVFESRDIDSFTMPEEPVKENYIFDGWYLDNDTWEKPFTRDNLLTEPIEYNQTVYAKFKVTHYHTLKKVNGKQSTCTEKGFKDYWKCDCGKLFSDSEGRNEIDVIPILDLAEHNWNDGLIIKQSTETEDGTKEFACIICDGKKTEIIEKHKHQWKNKSIKVQASCNKDGIEILECGLCGLTKENDIPALTHNYQFEKIIVKATCITKGKISYQCKNCGDVKTELTELAEHDFETTWTTDLKASCTTDGSKSHHCKNCDEKQDVTVIKATGHSIVIDPAVAATCSSTGLTEGSHCNICNKVITAQKTIGKKSHDFGSWITTSYPTYTSSGSKYRQCKTCSYKETQSIPKLVADIKLTISISKDAPFITNTPTATYTTTMNNNNTYSVTVTVSWKQSMSAVFMFNFGFNGTNTNTYVNKNGGSNTFSYTFNNIPTNVTKMSIYIKQR